MTFKVIQAQIFIQTRLQLSLHRHTCWSRNYSLTPGLQDPSPCFNQGFASPSSSLWSSFSNPLELLSQSVWGNRDCKLRSQVGRDDLQAALSLTYKKVKSESQSCLMRLHQSNHKEQMKEPKIYFYSVNQSKAVLHLKSNIAWKVIGIQREVSFFIKPRWEVSLLMNCFIALQVLKIHLILSHSRKS